MLMTINTFTFEITRSWVHLQSTKRGLFWPVGLITLAFQKYRCPACGSTIDGKPDESKLCGDCVTES